MASARRLKGLIRAIGFSLGAVLLGALVRTGTASALCGPVGPASAKNTACGTGTLTTGANASAFGFNALHFNTGGDNTASGANALQFNTGGAQNSAFGVAALYSNTIGIGNTASGWEALYSNTTGYYNTASGADTLQNNTTGGENTTSGVETLQNNTTGSFNTASGAFALQNNTTGGGNTAVGIGALASNATGDSNIGLGDSAGINIVAGSHNIDIGGGSFFLGDESNTIRIGTQGRQTRTYIAGISRTGVSSTNPVCVTGSGQLGLCSSSARYKRDIHDIGAASSGLMKLRPVVFRYRSEPNGQQQYGLIAEEVARVYPELVDYDNAGKPLTVHYLELNAMLLNELQKQSNQLQKQTKQLRMQNNQLQTQASQSREQSEQLQTQAKETRELAQRLETKDRQLAAQQREIDALKQQNASINTLSERLAALERQARTANLRGLPSLVQK